MTEPKARDYSETLFLPKTGFPMRAGLPQKEPEILARWQKLGLYARLRAAGLAISPNLVQEWLFLRRLPQSRGLNARAERSVPRQA